MNPLIVQRDQCRGRDLCCVNCGAPLDGEHKILCYAFAIARQAARRADTEPKDSGGVPKGLVSSWHARGVAETVRTALYARYHMDADPFEDDPLRFGVVFPDGAFIEVRVEPKDSGGE